jgi:putative endonuclease
MVAQPKATARRRTAYRRGRWGEVLALWCLRFKGYRILARGYRTGVGEIDIVAVRGRTLAIVEVKARDSVAGAVEAIGERQRQRIMRAARSFVASRPRFAGYAVRFDVVLVTPRRWPRHVADAWRADDPTT